jgi:FKBP-type peptidyl-prolyl cis-trans isomerase
MPTDPGNTLATARSFPIGAIARTVKDGLSATDQLDIWKLKLRPSNFSLSLQGIAKGANADAYLLNSRGQVIDSSRRSGNKDEQLNTLLTADTYYVAVLLNAQSADTQYRLTLAAPAPTDFLGNSFETASSLDLSSPKFSFNEFVGNTDPNDFIRFRLPEPGQLTLNLKKLSTDINLKLYDSKRNLIGNSSRKGVTNEKITRRLIDYGSTYYIQVAHTPNRNGFYNFSYKFKPDTPVTTASGLKYVDLVTGTGSTPTIGQTVTVQYTGTLEDGTKFDSSRDRNLPFSFKFGTGAVIPGFDEGVSTLSVGGRRQLIIPADLAYGTTGSGRIPPNSTIIFDIELLSIS